MAKGASDRFRSWCFTVNNYTLGDIHNCQYLLKDAVFGLFGEEVGENGTPHLQGYVSLQHPVSMNTLRKIVPRAHWTVALGTDIQNKEYCSKGKNIYMIGAPKVGQGTRTDLKEIADLIKNKEVTLEDLMFEYPDIYLRYSRSLEKMFNAVMKPRDCPPQVHWRWGKAGTGKTRYCIDKHPSHYIKDGTPWWDNYNQQEAIIIDDFDNNIPYRTLLRILDRYVYQGQVKGSYVQVNSPYIYITCEHPPKVFWEGNELAQIERRLTSVQEIK